MRIGFSTWTDHFPINFLSNSKRVETKFSLCKCMEVRKLWTVYPKRLWEHLDSNGPRRRKRFENKDEWLVWVGTPWLNKQRPTTTWPSSTGGIPVWPWDKPKSGGSRVPASLQDITLIPELQDEHIYLFTVLKQ